MVALKKVFFACFLSLGNVQFSELLVSTCFCFSSIFLSFFFADLTGNQFAATNISLSSLADSLISDLSHLSPRNILSLLPHYHTLPPHNHTLPPITPDLTPNLIPTHHTCIPGTQMHTAVCVCVRTHTHATHTHQPPVKNGETLPSSNESLTLETNANRRPAGKPPLTPLLHTHAIVFKTPVNSAENTC